MVTEPPAPAFTVIEPPGPQVISTAPVAVAGSQVILRLPPVWSTATPIDPSPVCSANADFIGGPGLSGGGSSSSNSSRLPAPLTKPRRTTEALIPVLFTASPPRSNAVCAFISPPSTYGRRGSPNSKPISTSSPTSGVKNAPDFLPAPNWATRAQSDSYAGDSQGSATFTRPRDLRSLLLVTMPQTSPGIRVGSPWVPPIDASPSSERSCRPLTKNRVR